MKIRLSIALLGASLANRAKRTLPRVAPIFKAEADLHTKSREM